MSRNRFIIPSDRIKIMTDKGENLVKFMNTSSEKRYALEDADWNINNLIDVYANELSSCVGTDSVWHRSANVRLDPKGSKSRILKKLKALLNEKN